MTWYDMACCAMICNLIYIMVLDKVESYKNELVGFFSCILG
jgi:hypothetical protein